MLTDPRPALAEQNNFVGYLMGLAGLARVVHALVRTASPADTPRSRRLRAPAAGLRQPGGCDRAPGRMRFGRATRNNRAPTYSRRTPGGCDDRGARSQRLLRTPVLANARPEGFKEWYHFVVHRPGGRILVNFSLTHEGSGAGSPGLTPRVIVIAHDQCWTAPSSASTAPSWTVRRPWHPGDRRQPDDRAHRRLPGGDRPARTRHPRRARLPR